MISNMLQIAQLKILLKKLSIPNNLKLPEDRQLMLNHLLSTCQRTNRSITYCNFPRKYHPYFRSDNGSVRQHTVLQHIIQTASFFSNNLFVKPFLLTGLKENQTVGLFIHNTGRPYF